MSDLPYVYYVSFATTGGGFGNGEIHRESPITDTAALDSFARDMEKRHGFPSGIGVVVLNFQLLRGPGGAA